MVEDISKKLGRMKWCDYVSVIEVQGPEFKIGFGLTKEVYTNQRTSAFKSGIEWGWTFTKGSNRKNSYHYQLSVSPAHDSKIYAPEKVQLLPLLDILCQLQDDDERL